MALFFKSMTKVLITGGTGAIGKHLIARLLKEKWQVNVVGRGETSDLPHSCNYYQWDLQKMKMPQASLEGVTHLVHLAGAGIADERWTDYRKREIRDSRVNPILLISRTLREIGTGLECVVSASGIGYYGAVTEDKVFVEGDDSNRDFLGRTCHAWENAITYVGDSCDREVRLRTGVVLMNEAGALPKLLRPVKFGLGAALGKGNQWVPWIHIDDLIDLYMKALTDKSLTGPANAVAPEHVTQSDLTKQIHKKLSRLSILPNVPALALKMMLGEMAEILLEGSRVSPQKIIDNGFEFRYRSLNSALDNLIT